MPDERERIATLEQAIRDMRGDIADRKDEESRTRKRLHDIEGLLGMLVDQQKQNRRLEATQYRRVELRLQMLTLAVAVGAIVVPLAVTLIHTR